MKELSLLSPAETLLILDPTQATAEQLARLTFLDLVLRKILVLEIRDTAPHNPNKTKNLRKSVSIGSNFKNYRPTKNESIFLKPFVRDSALKISLRNLIKVAFEGIESSNDYKLNYVYNKQISPYFSASLLQLLMGVKRLNQNGIKLQKRISEFLNSTDKELRSNKQHTNNLQEKLLAIHGNILLLKHMDHRSFKVLDESDNRKSVIQKKEDSAYYDYGLLYMIDSHGPQYNFGVLAATHTTFSNTMDSLDSFDSSASDSTGASDSGGCSGCGGCGGCS
ncbi:MAG: hypothetical protein JKY52_18370 [Flavobacteriales bacterium]|nr:hypothetical protein [Flavobacteriales bacterium]